MRILIITNVLGGLYNFRRELDEKLASEHEQIFALPHDPGKAWFNQIGCKYSEVPTDRRGTNPITDYKLYRTYLGIVRKAKPDVVLT